MIRDEAMMRGGGVGGLAMSPAEVVSRWPRDVGAAWLTSSGEGAWSRWTVLGIPTGEVVRREPWSVLGGVIRGRGGARDDGGTGLPFAGGWIGWLSYALGGEIEASVNTGADGGNDDRGWPDCVLVRCDSALIHDARVGRWRCVGDSAECGRVIEHVMRGGDGGDDGFWVGRLTSATGRARYERDVERAVGLIHAGDVFQVNLAHRLSGRFEGSARGLFARVMGGVSPWYGAFIEDGLGGSGGAVCSMSPELFLRVDGGTGRVVTRPMKGTRPAGEDPERLRGSEKDRAELAMIVDLMRNDLGRVCAFGSVRVDEAHTIEAHHGGVGGGVWQGVATVSGRVRDDVTHAGLLRAAFPPGSVTGAPKVRAMQIIREMEPVRRGPYCGAIGFVSDCGNAEWSVAIRTAAVSRDGEGRRIDYSVGAGIVADSDARQEWRETLAKAAAFRRSVRDGGGI